MDYTAEQINSAFDNIPPLRSKAMFRFDIDGISNEIVKKYGLDEEKTSDTITNILFTIIGLISFEDFKQFAIKELGIAYDRAVDLALDVEKMLLTPIEEKIKDFENEDEIIKRIEEEAEAIPAPLPPYIPYVEETIEKKETTEAFTNIKKEEESPKTEEGIYEKSGIEMMPEETISDIEKEEKDEEEMKNNENEASKTEVRILENSGIDVVEDVPKPEESNEAPEIETEKVMMEGLEHPENIAQNILMNKLKGNSMSNSAVSDHSLPKINTLDSK